MYTSENENHWRDNSFACYLPYPAVSTNSEKAQRNRRKRAGGWPLLETGFGQSDHSSMMSTRWSSILALMAGHDTAGQERNKECFVMHGHAWDNTCTLQLQRRWYMYRLKWPNHVAQWCYPILIAATIYLSTFWLQIAFIRTIYGTCTYTCTVLNPVHCNYCEGVTKWPEGRRQGLLVAVMATKGWWWQAYQWTGGQEYFMHSALLTHGKPTPPFSYMKTQTWSKLSKAFHQL